MRRQAKAETFSLHLSVLCQYCRLVDFKWSCFSNLGVALSHSYLIAMHMIDTMLQTAKQRI